MRRAGSGKFLGILFSMAWVALGAAESWASPLDLGDPRPRWVEVRFEISPSDAPGRLDRDWSRPLPAYFEPSHESGLVSIRVPAGAIEEHLRATGTDTVPGSFSEFVWTLDPETGHVVGADLTGRVREPVSLGLIRTTAEVDIRVEMTTRRAGGFRPASRFLGKQTNGFCTGPGDAPGCTLVPASPLDPRSGYVNAVGSVRAEIPLAKYQVFSPLGEARFSEWPRHGTEAPFPSTPPVGSGPSVTSENDAVCSVSFGGSC